MVLYCQTLFRRVCEDVATCLLRDIAKESSVHLLSLGAASSDAEHIDPWITNRLRHASLVMHWRVALNAVSLVQRASIEGRIRPSRFSSSSCIKFVWPRSQQEAPIPCQTTTGRFDPEARGTSFGYRMETSTTHNVPCIAARRTRPFVLTT